MFPDIKFFQGYTRDGSPYAISIVQKGALGLTTGTIRKSNGDRVKLPDLTAEQGYQLITTLPYCNIDEMLLEIEDLALN